MRLCSTQITIDIHSFKIYDLSWRSCPTGGHRIWMSWFVRSKANRGWSTIQSSLAIFPWCIREPEKSRFSISSGHIDGWLILVFVYLFWLIFVYINREHDKNPESFFRILFRLKEDGVNFKVSVLGESYSEYPGKQSFMSFHKHNIIFFVKCLQRYSKQQKRNLQKKWFTLGMSTRRKNIITYSPLPTLSSQQPCTNSSVLQCKLWSRVCESSESIQPFFLQAWSSILWLLSSLPNSLSLSRTLSK